MRATRIPDAAQLVSAPVRIIATVAFGTTALFGILAITRAPPPEAYFVGLPFETIMLGTILWFWLPGRYGLPFLAAVLVALGAVLLWQAVAAANALASSCARAALDAAYAGHTPYLPFARPLAGPALFFATCALAALRAAIRLRRTLRPTIILPGSPPPPPKVIVLLTRGESLLFVAGIAASVLLSRLFLR